MAPQKRIVLYNGLTMSGRRHSLLQLRQMTSKMNSHYVVVVYDVVVRFSLLKYPLGQEIRCDRHDERGYGILLVDNVVLSALAPS